jgi:hypothetical protein
VRRKEEVERQRAVGDGEPGPTRLVMTSHVQRRRWKGSGEERGREEELTNGSHMSGPCHRLVSVSLGRFNGCFEDLDLYDTISN